MDFLWSGPSLEEQKGRWLKELKAMEAYTNQKVVIKYAVFCSAAILT